MLEQDERIAKFLDAIDRDAQERRRQIEAQVDQANAEALERAKAEAQAQAQQLIRKELYKQRVAVNQKFAKEAASLRTALAGRRTEIADQVFLEADNRSVHLRKNLNIRPSSSAVRHAVRRSFRRGSR